MNQYWSSVAFPSDIPGREQDVFDFGALGVSNAVATPLARAFYALVSTYRSVSRRQAWASVRKFCSYLKLDPQPDLAMRRRAVLRSFLDHLMTSLSRGTSVSHYNFISSVYRWLGANDPRNSIIWLNVDAGPCNVKREIESTRRNVLSKSDMARIIVASKAGIDAVRRRMLVGESVQHARYVEGISEEDALRLRGISAGARDGVFGKPALARGKYIPFNTKYRNLRRFLLMDSRDFMPYIIYIICETLMNPNSAMELSVSCIQEHPVDPLKRRLTWDKHRASQQQMLDVSLEGRYAIPRLVDDLTKWSSVLRSRGGEHRDRLFLSPVHDYARTPSVQSWHNALQQFIAENELPDFNFVDIRISGAQLLNSAGLPLHSIRETMQHADSRTTLRYLKQSPARAVDRASIAKFIGSVVSEATHRYGVGFETTVGLSCKDETAGVAPGSHAGVQCASYLHCAVCPNSIAVIDSKKYVTRMASVLKALDSIRVKTERDEVLRARYESAFRSTHEVLVALMKKVPKRVLSAAMAEAEELPIQLLE